jgi:hypothetical protein
MSDQLSKAYFEEEERRQKQKEEQLLEKLKTIHLSIKESGQTLDKYLLMFEEGYRVIEKRFEMLKIEIKDLMITHQKQIVHLNQQHDLALKHLKEGHLKDLSDQDAAHQNEIKELRNTQHQAIIKLSTEHKVAIDKLIASHQEKLNILQTTMDDKLQSLKDTYLAKEADMNEKLEVNRKLAKQQQEQQETLQTERDVIKGELLVYKTKEGSQMNVEDFTSKERFLELERIRDAYTRIFSKSWQATKKAIRKEILSQPYENPKKEKHHGKKED